MVAFHIPSVPASLVVIPHKNCPGDPVGVDGAYVIVLDNYQRDDLDKLGYTTATETCLFCPSEETFVLRGKIEKTS